MMHPGRRKEGRTYKRPAREIVLERLAKTNLTVIDAAKVADRDRETISILFKKLKAARLIHIADWRTSIKGPHQPVYALGDEKDEPNPGRQSNSVRCRTYRAKRGGIPKPKDPIMRALLGIR